LIKSFYINNFHISYNDLLHNTIDFENIVTKLPTTNNCVEEVIRKGFIDKENIETWANEKEKASVRRRGCT